ncbi:MAG: Deoxyuridine 5'-triphosphate nucleotidohydrolase, partial [Paramarteilia canceri]
MQNQCQEVSIVEEKERSLKVFCKTEHPDLKIPTSYCEKNAGYNVAASQDAVVPAHGSVNINTGIAIAAPS